jgi:hypothetical protein
MPLLTGVQSLLDTRVHPYSTYARSVFTCVWREHGRVGALKLQESLDAGSGEKSGELWESCGRVPACQWLVLSIKWVDKKMGNMGSMGT